MSLDILFLLPARFVDAALDGTAYHCPACVHVEGLLACYPALRDKLDIRYVDYARPRVPIVELLGPEQQGCPVLIVTNEARAASMHVQRSPTTGALFVDGPTAISAYLAETQGVPPAHP